MFTNPFHFPFHRSIPYFSPVIIDAPLFHYSEKLLQATRSPRIWRWPERLDDGSISSYEQVYSIGFLSPQVSIVDIC